MPVLITERLSLTRSMMLNRLTHAGARRILLLVVMLAALGTIPLRAAEIGALDGEWVYVEDRTEGRALEQMGPPMSGTFSMRSEEGAVVLVSGHGSGHKNVRVALDGTTTEIAGEEALARYTGSWAEGVFKYQTEYVRGSDPSKTSVIRREFRPTTDGLIVTVAIGNPATSESVGLYRHAEDIEMPTPAKATIDDIAWLSGAWVGTRGASGTTSIEERWGPPLGGAMLATSRTVSRGRLSGFEYLRILEREGGLVYIAQPGGGAPTEFVMTEFDATHAVFDNPRHDYPKRITYTLSPEGDLTATIGFLKGGSPRRFEFKREH